jgi:energy-coupling factor transport system permease protein
VCRIGFHFQDYIVVLICFIPYVIWIVSMISRLFM